MGIPFRTHCINKSWGEQDHTVFKIFNLHCIVWIGWILHWKCNNGLNGLHCQGQLTFPNQVGHPPYPHCTAHTFLSLLTDHSSTDTRASLPSLTAARKDSASSMSSSADSPDEDDKYPSGTWPPGISSALPGIFTCDFVPFSSFFCRMKPLAEMLLGLSLTFGVKSLKYGWILSDCNILVEYCIKVVPGVTHPLSRKVLLHFFWAVPPSG